MGSPAKGQVNAVLRKVRPVCTQCATLEQGVRQNLTEKQFQFLWYKVFCDRTLKVPFPKYHVPPSYLANSDSMTAKVS